MGFRAHRAERAARELFHAAQGVGPLLQRDYWAVIANARRSPREVAAFVAEHFAEFPPSELVRFRRLDGGTGELRVGDELEVAIAGAGTFHVRCIHRDAQSLTLSTLAGHPEAGRITFGAYANDAGEVLFHIRSRARSGSRFHLAGFRALGEAMQTACWTEFVNNVCLTAGEGVVGFIRAVTTRLREDESDEEARSRPTYLARGDDAPWPSGDSQAAGRNASSREGSSPSPGSR